MARALLSFWRRSVLLQLTEEEEQTNRSEERGMNP
jgi:hypothetical protein